MSGQRRSRSASMFTENEINDLVLRLQVLLPQMNQRGNSKQSASKILQETCCHIRRLQKEVEELSERLSELMDSVDISDIDRRTLQNFLRQ
ncbi:transcription factor PRE4-like [Abrus precatorius]|uniref:Transcription factor PRE4-like n=1 Tax=Abrus precatorius TaxID=3816 RepID=A0A8B8L960_ABRPR|nr:transcription factor PRE4-like [Abrus precatorius]